MLFCTAGKFPPMCRTYSRLGQFSWSCATKIISKVELEEMVFFLHHNNAPAHSTLCMNFWLKTKCNSTTPFPTPDLILCDFFLLQNVTMALKRKRFNYIIMTYATLYNTLAGNFQKYISQDASNGGVMNGFTT
jgi:hypothetical protein